ncbi:MAG: putative Ig domain-containing protein, partial [Mucilaginibacter sp.]
MITAFILISWSGKAHAQAPTISYTPSTNVYTVGTAITDLTPTLGGGAADGYSSDALPAGLSFDTATGIITGTPTAVTAINTYTITAISAANGNTTTTITLTVNPAAPAISYNSPNTFVAGTAITPLSPSSTSGPVDTYSVSPALPAGLSIDVTTGIISGTPTTVIAAADYTVTATNVTNTATFPVNITINPALPAITYNTPNTFTYGTAITPLNPTSTGGAVATYSVSPALPAGLSIDATTGIISGTPTAAIAAADYTVTATNATGTDTFIVNITVDKAVLTATANDQTKVYGAANPSLTISYSGFVNGDTQAAINTLPTASTTATTASGVNSYAITAAGGVDNNYTFSYVAGTLTVT